MNWQDFYWLTLLCFAFIQAVYWLWRLSLWLSRRRPWNWVPSHPHSPGCFQARKFNQPGEL
jgi:hypothetical protein